MKIENCDFTKVAAYVLAPDGTPLMPMFSAAKVRKYLKSGKATVKSLLPFVIKLTKMPEQPCTVRVFLGIDPGRTNIGLCVIDRKGHVLYASDVETRNKAVKQFMEARSTARRASRNGKRNVRARRARKYHTTMTPSKKDRCPVVSSPCGMHRRVVTKKYRRCVLWERKLPGCKATVPIYDIRNKEARFSNRKREKGWLTPTANQLLLTHENAVNKVMSILPITDICFEMNKFDFARMENPNITKSEYQHGPLFGFASADEAVYAEQGGKCAFCKHEIEHYHHIIPRSKGGSESAKNKIGLCFKCHDKVHKEADMREKLVAKKEGLMKKYGALSVLNQIVPYFWKWLQAKEPAIHVYASQGWNTKATREAMGLPKEHYVDAYCIALNGAVIQPESFPAWNNVFHIKQFRRHDRAIIDHVTSRKYYLDGQKVATNRHKAVSAVPKKNKDGSIKYNKDGTVAMKITVQEEDSLEEFRTRLLEEVGPEETQRIMGRLLVEKSRHVKNKMDRVLPGALIRVDGKLHVLQGQHNNCTRYIEAVAGLTATKENIKVCRKAKTDAEKEGNSAKAEYLGKRIQELEAQLPKKIPEWQATNCEVLMQNTGLVYIPAHISDFAI